LIQPYEPVPREDPYIDPLDKEPRDNYHAAWFIFMILGTGILLPWNAFINAGDFFLSLYPEFPSFMFFLALAYNYSSILCLMASIKFLPRFSFGSRIISAFILDFIVLLIVPFLGSIFHGDTAIIMTYLGTFLTGIASSVLFGTIFALSALFPPKYSTAIMSGNGVAGILSSALRIITKVAEPDTKAGLQQSGVLYFSLGAGIIFICLISYLVLRRLPIAIYHLTKFNAAKGSSESDRLVNVEVKAMWRDTDDPPTIKTRVIFRKIWKEAFFAWGVFFVSLSLFPGITSNIKTTSKSIGEDWFGIILVAIFCVGDFIGRTLPKWFVVLTPRGMWIPTLLRFSFFILFPLCIKPKVFDSDVYAYIIMAVFAFTNGYLGTLAMMYGPTNASHHEKEVAGFIMTFSLNFGIFCGVHFALLVLYLLTGSIGVKF